MGVESQEQDRDDRSEAEGPLRRCIVSRAELPPDDLIRFVVDPAGTIVPDLARKLPGRGVWVTAEREAVAAAVKGNAFAKSLKRPVIAPADLPQTIETLFERRALEALSLTNKAGLVTTGFDRVEALLDGGQAAVLVHGSNAAADGRRKLDRKFQAIEREKGQIPAIVDWLTIEQLSLAIGRSNVVHAALKQGGVTQRFLRDAERLRRYRSGLSAF